MSENQSIMNILPLNFIVRIKQNPILLPGFVYESLIRLKTLICYS